MFIKMLIPALIAFSRCRPLSKMHRPPYPPSPRGKNQGHAKPPVRGELGNSEFPEGKIKEEEIRKWEGGREGKRGVKLLTFFSRFWDILESFLIKEAAASVNIQVITCLEDVGGKM